MRVLIKSIIVIVLLFISSNSTFAQIKVGGGLAFGSEIERIGITLRGTYPIVPQWEAGASFTFFLPRADPGVDFRLFEFNADAHYMVLTSEKFRVYPLAGLNISRWVIDYEISNNPFFPDDISDTNIGINVGAGGELIFTEKISGIAEVKYVISDLDQLVLNVGVLIVIGGTSE